MTGGDSVLASKRWAPLCGGAVVVFSLGLSTGLTWQPSETKTCVTDSGPQAVPASAEQRQPSSTQPAQRSKPQRVERAGIVSRPSELFVATDPSAEQRYRERQSADLLALLQNRVRQYARFEPDSPPEAHANSLNEYTAAWIDSTIRLAPDLAPEMASALEGKLCGSDVSSAEAIVMFRVMDAMPELASEEAFTCFLDAHPEEDAALWQALDAWKSSGLPELPQIERLRESAEMPQTLARFDEAVALERVAANGDQGLLENAHVVVEGQSAIGPPQPPVQTAQAAPPPAQ